MRLRAQRGDAPPTSEWTCPLSPALSQTPHRPGRRLRPAQGEPGVLGSSSEERRCPHPTGGKPLKPSETCARVVASLRPVPGSGGACAPRGAGHTSLEGKLPVLGVGPWRRDSWAHLLDLSLLSPGVKWWQQEPQGRRPQPRPRQRPVLRWGEGGSRLWDLRSCPRLTRSRAPARRAPCAWTLHPSEPGLSVPRLGLTRGR